MEDVALAVDLSKSGSVSGFRVLCGFSPHLALISLKSVIITKVLKTMVKCCEGGECSGAHRPESMPKKRSPAKISKKRMISLEYAVHDPGV